MVSSGDPDYDVTQRKTFLRSRFYAVIWIASIGTILIPARPWRGVVFIIVVALSFPLHINIFADMCRMHLSKYICTHVREGGRKGVGVGGGG
jgi:hypothetical protein